MTLVHVDDPVRHLGVEADQSAATRLADLQRGPAPAPRRRQVGRPNFSLDPMLHKRALDPRNEIIAIGLVIDVLQLAAAAFRKMAARWLLMMRPVGERA